MVNIEEVKLFWENNPLWTGESKYPAGSIEFFKEHREVYLSDCFAGEFDERFLPPNSKLKTTKSKVLDLGCGVGFWCAEFSERCDIDLHAADLTENAIKLTELRLTAMNKIAKFSVQNAEMLTYKDFEFDHVNCQGVIHHTPNTEVAIKEIARVLKKGGTASISVYYKNPILKLWPIFRIFGGFLTKLGGGLKGRGRENIFLIKNVDDIVRMYDGENNPIGKSYTKSETILMLEEYFEIKEIFLHFFPARSLPIKVPKSIHKFLDRYLGFMIFFNLKVR